MRKDCFVTVYHDFLQGIIDKHGNRSPTKTQAQLKAAMVRLLDTRGYHNTRINHICEEAGLAKGTFYTRFEDKEAIIVEILREYAQIQTQVMPPPDNTLSSFDTLHRFNYWFAKTFQENAGIQRHFMQLSETLPAVRDIWDDYLYKLTRAYVEAITRFTGAGIEGNLETIIVYSIGGMLDQALYAIYGTHRSETYEKAATDLDHLVEAITVLHHRALFLCNPAPDEIETTRALLDIRKPPR